LELVAAAWQHVAVVEELLKHVVETARVAQKSWPSVPEAEPREPKSKIADSLRRYTPQ